MGGFHGSDYAQECGSWAVSTVPITRFSTEQEAIDYFRNRCDPETGVPLRTFRSMGSAETE